MTVVEEGSVRWVLGVKQEGGTEVCGRWGETRAACPAENVQRGGEPRSGYSLDKAVWGWRLALWLLGNWRKDCTVRLRRNLGLAEGDAEDSDISNDEINHWMRAKDGECGFFERADCL